MCLVIGAYSADQGRLVLALSQPFPFSQTALEFIQQTQEWGNIRQVLQAHEVG
jgi:hypothetical protein